MINLLLSVERINDFEDCPLRYNYKHEKKLAPSTKRPWLDEGELMHKMLADYYNLLMRGEEINIPFICDLGRNYAAKNGSLAAAAVEVVIESFKEYTNHHRGSGTWEILGVEEPFAKELFVNDQLRIVIVGKNDLRIKTQSGKGPTAIVDHKYEAKFDEKPERDNQPLAYCWAYEVRDFIYNRIGKQKGKKGDEKFPRVWFNYSTHQIKDWVDSVIETATEILRCHEREKWPMKFKACNFRNAKCDFYDVCNTTPDNREYVINSLFGTRKAHTVMEEK